MTITIDTFSFGAYIHGTPVVPGWEFSRGIQRFPGVIGEQHLFGSLHGRNIMITFELYNLATLAALQTAVALMGAAVGTFGTLTIDLGGGDTTTLTLSTFDGAEPLEEPWKDGSGTNGWQQRFQLHFRQIAS